MFMQCTDAHGRRAGIYVSPTNGLINRKSTDRILFEVEGIEGRGNIRLQMVLSPLEGIRLIQELASVIRELEGN
jgi:hypothetical protein